MHTLANWQKKPIAIPRISEKVCSTCKLPLPLNRFYKHPTSTDGKRSECISCNRDRSHARYERLKSEA